MDVEFDSDLSDIFEEDVNDGIIRPYMYEPPKASASVDSSSEDDHELVEEIPDSSTPPTANVRDWCKCSNCTNMPTETECRCCLTLPVVEEKTVADGLRCVTQHQGFIDNCLSRYVLETSFYDHVHDNGPLHEGQLIHEVYRYLAYRRFTRWVYGLLGKKNRRVIPSCVVSSIRQRFPSEEYCGFKYPQ